MIEQTTQPSQTTPGLKANLRSMWMAGDFGRIAPTVSAEAEAFVARLGLSPATRVLDIACGTGNTSLPLARRDCLVTGVDIAPNLLAQARERAQAEALSILFDEGDAEALPYANASFDAAISMFGAMFAPRPALVAAEMARVLRPGGKLAMANWSPAGFSGRMFKLSAAHVPPPPGLPAPVLWGDPSIVRERLEDCFTDIRTELIAIDFDLPTAPRGAVDLFRSFYGPTRTAFNRLDPAGQAAFSADLESLWTAANDAPDPLHHTLVHNEYLQVLAVRR